MTPDVTKRRSRLSKFVTRIASFKKDERTRPHSYVAPENVRFDEPSSQPQSRQEATVKVVVTNEAATSQEPLKTTPTDTPEIVVREPTPVEPPTVVEVPAKPDDHVTQEATPTESQVTAEATPTISQVTQETPVAENHVTKETPPTDTPVPEETATNPPEGVPSASNHVIAAVSTGTGMETAAEDSKQTSTSTTPTPPPPPEGTPTSVQPGDPDQCPPEHLEDKTTNTEATPTKATAPSAKPQTTPPEGTLATTTLQPTHSPRGVSPLTVHKQARPTSPKSPQKDKPPTKRKMSDLASQLPEIPSAPVLPEEVRNFLCRKFAADDMRDFLASLPDSEDSTPLPSHYHSLLSTEKTEDYFPSMEQLQHFLADCA